MAAGMMSSAAIANGGGVAAGSTIAVLQSVAAAGLGTSGMAAVGGLGAATSAGVAAGVNFLVDRVGRNGKTSENKISDTEETNIKSKL